jgi:two-component system, NtrC family, sensor kinase
VRAKILYVDDDYSNLVVFRETFGTEFDILTAQSGQGGLEVLRLHRDVALLVSDQRMPVMQGTELCEIVRRDYPHVVRYLMTAYSDLTAAIDAINRGQVQRYLRKPWEPTELRMHLLDAVELHGLRRRTNELEGRMREVDRVYTLGVVAGGVVHELRNPLGALMGTLDLVRRKVADDPALIGLLDQAQMASTRMADTLRAVELSTRRTAQGSADLAEVIRLTLRMVGPHLQGRATLELELEQPLTVQLAPTPLGQIVLNLLINAMQAIPDDADPATMRVRIVARACNGGARLEVSDTGSGVPNRLKAKIFDPFFTTKEDGGTGLGLAICKQIVVDAEGTISVEDAPGGGACFVVELPRAQPEHVRHAELS